MKTTLLALAVLFATAPAFAVEKTADKPADVPAAVEAPAPAEEAPAKTN